MITDLLCSVEYTFWGIQILALTTVYLRNNRIFACLVNLTLWTRAGGARGWQRSHYLYRT